jgi:hypothetical protein
VIVSNVAARTTAYTPSTADDTSCRAAAAAVVVSIQAARTKDLLDVMWQLQQGRR